MKKNPISIGILQALCVFAYTFAVSMIMNGMEKLGKEPDNQMIGIAVFLTLFVLSAGTCAAIVFGYPVFLIVQKQVREAVKVLVTTFLSLIVILIGFFSWIII